MTDKANKADDRKNQLDQFQLYAAYEYMLCQKVEEEKHRSSRHLSTGHDTEGESRRSTSGKRPAPPSQISRRTRPAKRIKTLPQTEFSDSSDSVESERTVGPDKTIGTDESEKPVNSKKWWTKWAITMGLATGLATVLAISAFKGILNWRSIRRVHGFEQTH